LTTATNRIVGCLAGLATGDATGKQTETLSRSDVLRWYPDGVHGFEGTPGSMIPRYVGNRKREWLVGETTDDTERTLAVARAILRDGCVRHETVGRELLQCTKCVHPGIQSSWEFHQAADPARIAREHDGCGAAVRVAPAGIILSSGRFHEIVASSREASVSTHGGALALAAAAATAMSVSAAIDGAPAGDILELACRAADRAELDASGSRDTAFSQAIRTIYSDLCASSEIGAAEVARKYFPDAPLTIVPLAISLATIMDSAESAILVAANVGGDSDSVASIAGAILGARFPETVNPDWCAVVEKINRHDLTTVAEALTRLRS
jgi:ADP-ribosylglycohydrolase